MNEEHSTHEMVKNLHSRFGAFEKHIGERFTQIENRVGVVEKGLAADIAHLEKHESEAELKGAAVLEKLTDLTRNFAKRAEREDSDRRWLLGIVLVTMIGSIGSLLMLVLTSGAA